MNMNDLINRVEIEPDLDGDGEFFLGEHDDEYRQYIYDVWPSFSEDIPITVLGIERTLESDLIFNLFRVNPSFWVSLLETGHKVRLYTNSGMPFILAARILNGQPGFAIIASQ